MRLCHRREIHRKQDAWLRKLSDREHRVRRSMVSHHIDEMATAPRQREIFLNEARVFIQCPQLMTDNALADVLAQYVSAVRAKTLPAARSVDVPKGRGERNKERRKGRRPVH